MGLVEACYVALGVALGVVGIALVRWLLLRPIQRTITDSMIEELNHFSAQIRKLNDHMANLTRSIETGSKGKPVAGNVEISETLSEMNRLLKDINASFAGEDELEELGYPATDFVSADEQEKFLNMEEISEEELARTNWDELIDRLRNTSE